MNPTLRFECVESNSPLIDDAARLHVESLTNTLTSSRGSQVVAGIYRRLVREGHSLYLAVDGDSVVGGLMVMLHGKSRAVGFTIAHRPSSWLTTVRKLGLRESLRQVFDLIQVMRETLKLAPHDYIVALYVDLRARRTGVARGLIGRAITDSSNRGVGLGVDTLQDNEAARRFYENCGFREWTLTTRSTIVTLAVD